jgi:hypothetical protein
VVVDCQQVGEFLTQTDAERAYNAARGLQNEPLPPDLASGLPNRCGGPDATPPPAIGGTWRCVNGRWEPGPPAPPAPPGPPPAGGDAPPPSGEPPGGGSVPIEADDRSLWWAAGVLVLALILD